MKTIHSALAIFAFMIVGSVAANAAAEVGSPAPALTVKTIDGSTFNLAAARGHVVIVNFWATWCEPCRAEMPALDAFYRAHHDEGLELIGISEDRTRDKDDVVKVMEAFKYPAGMINDADPNGFGKVRVLPITYVIDANGIVRAALSPDKTPINEKTLAEYVSPLIPKH